MTLYPTLGVSVSYLRFDGATKEIVEGEGMVQAILIDPNGRATVLVKDGDNAWNVELYCVNAPEEDKEAYKVLMQTVIQIGEDGNEEIAVLTNAWNDRVEAAYNDLLGEPIG